MLIARLNTDKIVQVLRVNARVQFNDRSDNVLVFTPIGARPRKRDLRWVNATQVVWMHNFEFQPVKEKHCETNLGTPC